MNVGLCEVRAEDVPILYRWFNDEKTYGEFDEPSPVSMEKLEQKLRSGGFHGEGRCTLIIWVDGIRVGFVNFMTDPIDPWIGQLGVVIAIEKKRNQGIGTVAHRLAVRYVFDNYPSVAKIEAVTDKNNHAERRVLEKAGFVFEGILRWRNRRRGQFYDMAYYGTLRSEFCRNF